MVVKGEQPRTFAAVASTIGGLRTDELVPERRRGERKVWDLMSDFCEASD